MKIDVKVRIKQKIRKRAYLGPVFHLAFKLVQLEVVSDSGNYFEVGGVVTSNCMTMISFFVVVKISFFVEFGADTSCDIRRRSI